MYINVELSQFRDAFNRMGRGTQFSHEGLEALFDYLTELEESTGDLIELDVIDLCCDYTESTPHEIAEEYDIDLEDADDDEALEIVRGVLEDEGTYIGRTSCTILYTS